MSAYAEQRSHIFISYSHEDELWLNRLLTMLKPATRSRTVTVWTDTEIKPGARWRDEIHAALDQATLAVLLVSPNFLASDFIATEEFPFFLNAAEKRGLRILWIPISACLFEMTQIADYQALSNPRKPLDTLNAADINVELATIARKIVATAEERREADGMGRTAADGAPALSLDEKLLKAARDAGMQTVVSRMSKDIIGLYSSSREELMRSGRISPRKPPPVIETTTARAHASMQLAGILIAEGARSGQRVPQDLWPQLSNLPGIRIDKDSFQIDSYDVIYRAWLDTGSGAKEVWARVANTNVP